MVAVGLVEVKRLMGSREPPTRRTLAPVLALAWIVPILCPN